MFLVLSWSSGSLRDYKVVSPSMDLIANCMHQGIAEEEDVAALPTIQYWKGGKCVDVSIVWLRCLPIKSDL